MAIEGKDDGGAVGRIRLGMVGGGEGAFIGAVHRLAARMDDHYTFVAGALSSTPEKALRSGAALGLDPKRPTTCTRRWRQPFSRPASTSSATSR